MKRESQPRGRADVAAHSDLMRGLMWTVITFMVRTGMSEASIRNVFLHCVSRIRRGSKKVPVANKADVAYGCDTIAGAVLRAWHRFPKYLDTAARPICLREDGPEPNLVSLVLSQDKNTDPKAVIRSMLNAGLLKKRAPRSYLPAKDSATVESLDPLAIDHIAKTVMRLVETASQNISKSRDKLQLIERYAHVPDLTKTEARAFAVFSRQQGQACLDSIEDWLESRQVKQSSRTVVAGRGINAGVHIFAYLGSSASARKKAVQSGLRRRATPSREARV